MIGSWISIYFYHDDSQFYKVIDEFISIVIKEMTKRIKLKRFFYVRYYDDFGHHIRLRLLVAQKYREEIQTYLTNEYTKYLKNNPSVFSSINNKYSVIRQADYVPEYGRYGGYKAISTAEEQFYTSSRVCMYLIRKYKHADYGYFLGHSLKLTLYYMLVTGYDKNTLQFLLQSVIDDWISSAIKNLETYNLNGQPISNHVCLEHFNSTYNKDRDIITKHLEASVLELISSKKNNISIYMRWLNRNSKIITKLKVMEEQGNLHCDYQNHSKIKNNILAISSSFIHMTNNRLGINNRDEAYLAYILLRYIQTSNVNITLLIKCL